MPYADVREAKNSPTKGITISIIKRNNKTENNKWIFSLKKSARLVAN